MADEQKNEVTNNPKQASKAQPSGPKGDNPATAGRGNTKVEDGPAEQAEGQLNPASPGNTGTTPGSNVRTG